MGIPPLSRRENFMQSMQTYAIHWKSEFGYGAVCEAEASRRLFVTGQSTHCRATVEGRSDRSRTRVARVAEGNVPGASAPRDDHRRRHLGNGVCPRRRITDAVGVVAVVVVRGADGTVAGAGRSFPQQDPWGVPVRQADLFIRHAFSQETVARSAPTRATTRRSVCVHGTSAPSQFADKLPRQPPVLQRFGAPESPGNLAQCRAHAPRHHCAPRAIRSLQ